MIHNKNNLLIPVLKLMCLFSLFVLIIDIGDLFLDQFTKEFILEALHVLQILTVIFFLLKNKISFKDISLFNNKTSFIIAFLSIVIGLIIMEIGSLLESYFSFPSVHITESSFASTIFMLLFAGFIAPVFEEIEFRALLFQTFRRTHSTLYALIFSSLMFFVLHTGYLNFGALCLGIVSSLILLWTDNLIYSILIHFAGNFGIVALGFLSFFLPDINEMESISESASNELMATSQSTIIEFFEPIIELFLLAIILITIMMFIYKKNKKSNSFINSHNFTVNKTHEIGYYIFYFVVCIGSTIMQIIVNIYR